MKNQINILLSSLNNGVNSGLKSICIKSSLSKQCFQLLNVLYKKGYIRGFKIMLNSFNNIEGIIIFFKFDKSGFNVINHLTIISKPGRRIYSPITHLWKIGDGSTCFILSTSKGLITDMEARLLNIGGEVLCSIA